MLAEPVCMSSSGNWIVECMSTDPPTHIHAVVVWWGASTSRETDNDVEQTQKGELQTVMVTIGLCLALNESCVLLA